MLCQHLSSETLAETLAKDCVVIIGAGVAGLRAAQSLASLNIPSLLVEKNAHLGGMVMRLDKVYPSDHCAFCPTSTMARSCIDSPLITVLLDSEVTDLTTDGDEISVHLSVCSPRIDRELCLFCGACREICPQKALLPRDPSMTWDCTQAPVMHLDAERCDGCGKCLEVCQAGAIHLQQNIQEHVISARDVISATGFREITCQDARSAPEFGLGTHSDILTAMEFEQISCESNGKPVLVTRSDQRPVKNIAFVQCAGARDQRKLSYCAAVCCMHAMKQARWIKRRQPELEVTVFYTDLRAPGAGQEAYVRKGASEGLRLVRSRPGLVMAAPASGIAVRFEDPESGQAVHELFDLVVVNGGLAPCQPAQSEDLSRMPGIEQCGFCREPADIAASVTEGACAALNLALAHKHRGGAQ